MSSSHIIWKQLSLNGYIVEVSNTGLVRTVSHTTKFYHSRSKNEIQRTFGVKYYTQMSNKEGYKYICVKCKHYRVHRLVAEAFIPNIENKPVVNHLNGIKYDNNVDNLEWYTRSENDLHAFKIGLRDYHGLKHPQFGKYIINKEKVEPNNCNGERNNNAKLNSEAIIEIRNLAGTMIQSDIAKLYNVSQSMVSAIIRRANWKDIN